jgi:hypothetical protein
MPLLTDQSPEIRNRDKLRTAPDPQSPRRFPADTPERDKTQDVTRFGLGAAIEGLAGREWKTEIEWKPVRPDCGDGTEVEAKRLGPDHKLGEQPHTNKHVSPNATWFNDMLGLKADEGYVRGHLLNDKVGGPGNDDRNLVAIPQTTNKVGMKHVEDHVKAIVNEKHGWMYFKATAIHQATTATDLSSTKTEKTDTRKHKKKRKAPVTRNIAYARRLEIEWHELGADAVTGDPIKVGGTEGTCQLDIPDPDTYLKIHDNTSDKTMSYGAGTDAGNYGAEERGKQDRTLHPDSAVTDVPWDAIILKTWDKVATRTDALQASRGEVGRARQSDSTAVVDAFRLSPDDPEQRERLESALGRAEGDEHEGSTPLLDELRQMRGRLAAQRVAMQARLSAIVVAHGTDEDVKRLHASFGKQEAPELQDRAIDAIGEKSESADRRAWDAAVRQMSLGSLDAVYRRLPGAGKLGDRDRGGAPMSVDAPPSGVGDLGARRDAPGPSASHKRKWIAERGNADHEDRVATRKLVAGQAPTGTIEKFLAALDRLPAGALDRLPGLGDDLHGPIKLYGEGKLSRAAMRWLLLGLQHDDEDGLEAAWNAVTAASRSDGDGEKEAA